jgi:hypothetical protein
MRWLVEPSIDVSPRRRRRSAWRPWAGLRSAVHARAPGGGSFAVSTNGGGSDGQAGTRKLRPSQSVAAISPGGGSDRELRVGGCDLAGHAVNVGYFGVPAESTSKVGRRGGRVGVLAGDGARRWCGLRCSRPLLVAGFAVCSQRTAGAPGARWRCPAVVLSGRSRRGAGPVRCRSASVERARIVVAL